MDWEGEEVRPLRLTARGKVVVAALWIGGTGLAGWFAPIGWWM